MESPLGFGDIGTALPTHWMVFGPESYRPELAGRQISKHKELLSYSTFLCLRQWQLWNQLGRLKNGLSQKTEEMWVCPNMIYILMVRNHSYIKTCIYVKRLPAPWIRHPFCHQGICPWIREKVNINKNLDKHDRFN